ncbi:MAG: sigma-70 family RNA polymerase sigma factor [Gemmatimonadota bacterium]|nr:sigma-70 family RNA polymerase sigma factor [Gemmatimonadota bacterium]
MSSAASFEDAVTALFNRQFGVLFRYINRLGGDPDLASDLAQEAFVKLYERGAMPDAPRAWLAAVATNLLRDAQRTAHRREDLVVRDGSWTVVESPEALPDAVVASEETRAKVRSVLATLTPRDQQLLLLRHEGYSYRDLATAVGVAEASVGTLLLRATRAFRDAYTRKSDGADATPE